MGRRPGGGNRPGARRGRSRRAGARPGSGQPAASATARRGAAAGTAAATAVRVSSARWRPCDRCGRSADGSLGAAPRASPASGATGFDSPAPSRLRPRPPCQRRGTMQGWDVHRSPGYSERLRDAPRLAGGDAAASDAARHKPRCRSGAGRSRRDPGQRSAAGRRHHALQGWHVPRRVAQRERLRRQRRPRRDPPGTPTGAGARQGSSPVIRRP
jgi:hypothetical protein